MAVSTPLCPPSGLALSLALCVALCVPSLAAASEPSAGAGEEAPQARLVSVRDDDGHSWRARRRAQRNRPSWDIGAGASVLTIFDDWLDGDGVGEAGGVLVSLRWRMVPALGLSSDFGVMLRFDDGDDGEETRLSSAFGVMWYVLPGDWLQVYLGAGLGVSSAYLELDGAEHEYVELGPYLSLGTDFVLPHTRVTTELRGVHLHRTDEDELLAAQSDVAYSRAAPEDRFAAMINIVLHYTIW